MSNYEFHNGLRNPGLYSLISHKSAAADEKRIETLQGVPQVRGNDDCMPSSKVQRTQDEYSLTN
jgi:hypothetical protein